ncbi:MAG TPA: SDR family oxidoreductase [Acidimicrobiales bacterium]
MPFEHGGRAGPGASDDAAGTGGAGGVALVTGGASGIGAATVRQLRAAGWRVAVADLDVSGVAVGDAGADADADADTDADLAVAADVTDEDAVAALVAEVVDRFGRLDAAVNSAGVSGTFGNVVDQPADEWRRVVDVNLTAVFLCVRAELRQMLAQEPRGGSIVNVASAAGSMGVPGLAHYSASKHGVIGLTKTAALEVARKGVRVNAVLPGTVRTPMLQRFAGGDEGVTKMGTLSPIGRAAEPDEIAALIAWLCTPAASYVTGAALPADGGSLAT